jgi:nucleoid-associated protein YgaU
MRTVSQIRKRVGIYQVKAKDRLPVIAAKVYGDPRLWRLIADANGIIDPLRFPTGDDIGKNIRIP